MTLAEASVRDFSQPFIEVKNISPLLFDTFSRMGGKFIAFVIRTDVNEAKGSWKS
jgi:hypothetical protein